MTKIFAVIVILLSMSCTKSANNDSSPNETHMNFVANGQYFAFLGPAGFAFPRGVNASYLFLPDGTLRLSMSCVGVNNSIDIRSYTAPTMHVKLRLVDSSSDYVIYDGNNYDNYTFDTTGKSYIMFSTIDSKRIAGTFACYGTNDMGKAVSITNGNFNILR